MNESIEVSSTSAMVAPVMDIATSSFPDTSAALALQVGTSLTALTVMATVSVAPSAPSLGVMLRTALVLSLLALVQVMVAIARLMLATVPEKVIALSAVPSPTVKLRPVVWASE